MLRSSFSHIGKNVSAFGRCAYFRELVFFKPPTHDVNSIMHGHNADLRFKVDQLFLMQQSVKGSLIYGLSIQDVTHLEITTCEELVCLKDFS